MAGTLTGFYSIRAASKRLVLWLALAVVPITLGHAQQGSRGEALFLRHCADCHSIRQGKNGKGPSLAGAVERRAGGAPGFQYSDAMKGAALTWTPEVLDRYLTSPKATVPGTRMKFRGLPDADSRAALIKYLESVK